MADCPFGWGGQTWGPGDLQPFKDWLADHGANYDAWADNHPDAVACLEGRATPSSSALPPVPSAAATITQLEGPPVPPAQQPAAEQTAQAALAGAGPPPELAPPAYIAETPGGGIVTTPIPEAAPSSPPPQPIPAKPTAQAPVAAGPSPGGQITFSHNELEGLWIAAGGNPSVADVAAAIAQAESGGCRFAHAGPTDNRPEAICTLRITDGEDSYGLWQVNQPKHPQYDAISLYDAAYNAKAAVEISSNGTDFCPWSTYEESCGPQHTGAYRQYLTGKVSPVQPAPPPLPTQAPPSSPPAGIGQAWNSVLDVYAHTIPQQADQINDAVEAVKGAIV